MHFNRMISEKSVNLIEEFHKYPKMRKSVEISQIKWPKLGSLSSLKHMIEENRDQTIDSLVQDRSREPALCHPELKHHNEKLTDFQLELLTLLRTNKDLLYTNESADNLDDIQRVYVLHALNHLMNTRKQIISNNKVFEKKTLSESIINDDPKLRDQGFTRAKILFLMPFRFSAMRLGKCLVSSLGPDYTIHHLDRFIQEFGDEDGTDSSLRPFTTDNHRPSDYYQTFHGNTDDSFRLGLKFTKKSIKFFSDFYDSDIIIASPLGIKTILSPDEQQAVAATDREQEPVSDDKDFLSSIEIVILDQADVFLMQNWEHLIDIMQHINLMPNKPRKMDISRVRPWFLENWSKYYRQLLMFASVSVPLLHSFFQTNSLNYEGYLTFKHRVDNPQAKLVTSWCKQQFLYYDSTNVKDACDDRYHFFIKNVLPKLRECENQGDTNGDPLNHTMIMVSSYFDFVRLRNYFRREKLSFTQICEYTEDNKVSKARQLFYFGARQFMIYTERCHFYHRYKIKGIRRLIFYEPPTYAKFYSEMANLLVPELQGKKFSNSESNSFITTTLFSNHDTLQIGAIIGYSNAVKLIENKKSIE